MENDRSQPPPLRKRFAPIFARRVRWILLGAFALGVVQFIYERATVALQVYTLWDIEMNRPGVDYVVYVDGTRLRFVGNFRVPGGRRQAISLLETRILHARKFVLEPGPRDNMPAGVLHRFDIEIPRDQLDCDLVIDFRQPVPVAGKCDLRFEESADAGRGTRYAAWSSGSSLPAASSA